MTTASTPASTTMPPTITPNAFPASTAERHRPVAAQADSGTMQNSPASTASNSKEERI